MSYKYVHVFIKMGCVIYRQFSCDNAVYMLYFIDSRNVVMNAMIVLLIVCYCHIMIVGLVFFISNAKVYDDH